MNSSLLSFKQSDSLDTNTLPYPSSISTLLLSQKTLDSAAPPQSSTLPPSTSDSSISNAVEDVSSSSSSRIAKQRAQLNLTNSSSVTSSVSLPTSSTFSADPGSQTFSSSTVSMTPSSVGSTSMSSSAVIRRDGADAASSQSKLFSSATLSPSPESANLDLSSFSAHSIKSTLPTAEIPSSSAAPITLTPSSGTKHDLKVSTVTPSKTLGDSFGLHSQAESGTARNKKGIEESVSNIENMDSQDEVGSANKGIDGSVFIPRTMSYEMSTPSHGEVHENISTLASVDRVAIAESRVVLVDLLKSAKKVHLKYDMVLLWKRGCVENL